MERKYMTSTMTHRMKKILEDTRVMAEDLMTEAKPKVVLGYIALAVSFVAGVLAILPIIVWFGAGQVAHKLMEDHKEK